MRAGIILFVSLVIAFMINLFSPSVALTMDRDYRLLFWITLCLIGGAGIFVCDAAFTFLDVHLSSLSKSLMQSVAGSIAVLIPVFLIYDPAELPSFGTTIIFVWAIMVLIVAGAFILGPKKTKLNEAIARNQPEVPKVLARLPVHLQDSELYAISAEDHYVRVHTSKGDSLILMRLSDAMVETGSLEGLQVHRSWWVAKSAIDDIKSKGRAAEVTLKNNVKAPVSRNGLKALKSIGWL